MRARSLTAVGFTAKGGGRRWQRGHFGVFALTLSCRAPMSRSIRLVSALVLALCSLSWSSATAQRGGGAGSEAGQAARTDTGRRVLVVPGQRDGTSAFPLVNYKQTQPLVAGQMDFQHYHTSAEVEEWMRRWARERPDLVELYVVGKSFGGRDLLQLT